jgi:hypothetical protein
LLRSLISFPKNTVLCLLSPTEESLNNDFSWLLIAFIHVVFQGKSLVIHLRLFQKGKKASSVKWL